VLSGRYPVGTVDRTVPPGVSIAPLVDRRAGRWSAGRRGRGVRASAHAHTLRERGQRAFGCGYKSREAFDKAEPIVIQAMAYNEEQAKSEAVAVRRPRGRHPRGQDHAASF